MGDLHSFLRVVIATVLYIGLGVLVAFIFYNLKKRDLFGGYIGGLVVGVIGAIIGDLVLHTLFYDKFVTILRFLSEGAGVDLIAGFIGAYAALYVMNRLNHNRERKKY